jgi:hypothetical protein
MALFLVVVVLLVMAYVTPDRRNSIKAADAVHQSRSYLVYTEYQ